MAETKDRMLKFALLLTIFWAVLMPLAEADAALLYKSYTVRYDRGWELLCDPYVVQKDDWVLKLFRQKGEIAQNDFPEFLRIFKRLNPHIDDIDRIRPGERIVIPLRKLKRGALPGQSAGVVHIPFVTISGDARQMARHSAGYVVRKGDCVSSLIAAKFGLYGSTLYHEGLRLFRLLNPHIQNLDRILTGQVVYLPDPSVRRKSWYAALFDPLNPDGAADALDQPQGGHEDLSQTKTGPGSRSIARQPLAVAAEVLGAQLFNHGIYYLPRSGQEDLALDLARYPVLVLKSGVRIVLLRGKPASEIDPERSSSSWPQTRLVRLAENASAEELFEALFRAAGIDTASQKVLFSDHGVKVEVRGKWIVNAAPEPGEAPRKICLSLIERPEQQILPAMAAYLEQHQIVIKDVLSAGGQSRAVADPGPSVQGAVAIVSNPLDQRTFVRDLMQALGYHYTPNVSVTFPYANVQVQARSNLLTRSGGVPILVDFGDFYGDALTAIQNTGIDVVQVKAEDGLDLIVHKLMHALGLTFSRDPTFWAARRPEAWNTALTIPGVLISDGAQPRALLARVSLHEAIVELLKRQGMAVVIVAAPGQYS